MEAELPLQLFLFSFCVIFSVTLEPPLPQRPADLIQFPACDVDACQDLVAESETDATRLWP